MTERNWKLTLGDLSSVQMLLLLRKHDGKGWKIVKEGKEKIFSRMENPAGEKLARLVFEDPKSEDLRELKRRIGYDL